MLADPDAERVPVRAPELPDNAPALARLIYEDMLERWEKRLAVLEDRALPYATTEPGRRGIDDDSRNCSRAIRWLVRNDLVWVVPDAKCENGAPMKTRCFLPGPKPDGPAPEDGWRVSPRRDREES